MHLRLCERRQEAEHAAVTNSPQSHWPEWSRLHLCYHPAPEDLPSFFRATKHPWSPSEATVEEGKCSGPSERFRDPSERATTCFSQ